MTVRKALAAGVSVFVLCAAGGAGAKPKPLKCASPEEVTAMQTTAVQQLLMDAALTCGDTARINYNAFQTRFNSDLRSFDRTMLRMFTRVMGGSKGDKAYNLFKTELAAKAELRRLGNHDDFCQEANLVAAAALGPLKIVLADFVADVPAHDVTTPVGRCDIQVAVTLRGTKAAPAVVPKPNPLRVAAPPPASPQPVAVPPAPAATQP
jgi:hypothetical protein